MSPLAVVCPSYLPAVYGAAGAPKKFRDRPTLQKPFLIEKLEKAIEEVLRGGAQSVASRATPASPTPCIKAADQAYALVCVVGGFNTGRDIQHA
jgi:hypothetical protein